MKYNTVNDSLLSREKNRLLLEMKTKFETNNKIKENELLQNKITIQNMNWKKRNQTIFSGRISHNYRAACFLYIKIQQTKFQKPYLTF